MQVLIVYAHPSKKSFTHEVLQKLIEGLKASNHTIEISDLYDMGFVSDMSEKEYEREGFAKTELAIPSEIIKEHRKIEKADCIIFLYPVWWSDCPAKLKGWFDRVYSVGYAYGYDNKGNNIQKMKKVKSGLVICTAGHPNNFLDKIGIAKSMKTIMIDDRLGQRFEKKEMIILGGTLNIEKVKKNHLTKVFEIGKNIKNRILN